MSINLLPSNDSLPRMADLDELRFAFEQARRYVMARPWERLGGTSLYLDLKAGSWFQACVEHVSNGQRTVAFIFPGHRNMPDFQRAGFSEPPAGTIFVELVDEPSTQALAELAKYGWPDGLRPIAGFQTITPYGWSPLERRQLRLLALAFAAISDFDAATDVAADSEIAGELPLPGATRGRYRVRRAPADDGSTVPLLGMTRHDLYGEGEGTLTFTSMPWSEYCALRSGALLFRPAKLAFEARTEIPLVAIAGFADQAAAIAEKVKAADPLGVVFGEMDGSLAAILVGVAETYVLVDTQEEKEALMLWRHMVMSSGGAHAIVVNDSAEPKTQTVHAIFECRSGPS